MSVARADAARRASGSLDARLSELRERVQHAEQRVEDYKRKHGIISSSGTPVNERQVTELNSQLMAVRARAAETKARYDKIRDLRRGKADPGAIGEATGSATITALRTQLGEILRREGEINATLGKRHPAVIEIELQARRIRRLIDEEVERIGEAAHNDWERAKANEATLAAALETLKSGLEDTNEASVRLRELDRDVAANRSVYEAYLVRMREVSEQERLDITNVRVIASPELPESKSFPPRMLILLALGGMLGGALGAALAFFREWRARHVPATTAVPSLAAIDARDAPWVASPVRGSAPSPATSQPATAPLAAERPAAELKPAMGAAPPGTAASPPPPSPPTAEASPQPAQPGFALAPPRPRAHASSPSERVRQALAEPATAVPTPAPGTGKQAFRL